MQNSPIPTPTSTTRTLESYRTLTLRVKYSSPCVSCSDSLFIFLLYPDLCLFDIILDVSVRSTTRLPEPGGQTPGKKPTSKRKPKTRASGEQHELTALALKACLIARDAAYNIKDLLTNSSRM